MPSLDAAVMAGFDSLPRVDLGSTRREERLRLQGRSRRRLLALAALLILGPCLLAPATRQALDLRAQLGDSDRQLAAVNAQWQRVTQTTSRTDARIALWAKFRQSRDGRRVWDDALPALAAALPGGVSLQRAQITGGGRRRVRRPGHGGNDGRPARLSRRARRLVSLPPHSAGRNDGGTRRRAARRQLQDFGAARRAAVVKETF